MSSEQREGIVLDFGAAKRRREQSTDPWVKKERVAAHFDVSTRTVYRWVEQGCPIRRLPGGTLRFQIAVIADWLQGRG